MSNPGMTPLTMQQVMDFQKQQAMANALMTQNAPANTPYAGLANAGGTLAGALANKNIANNEAWAQQGISPVTVTPKVGSSWMSNLFGLGGQ